MKPGDLVKFNSNKNSRNIGLIINFDLIFNQLVWILWNDGTLHLKNYETLEVIHE